VLAQPLALELLLLDQVAQVLPHLVLPQLLRGTAEVADEVRHRQQVHLLGEGGVAVEVQVLLHLLA
jgi:hypothetical protein